MAGLVLSGVDGMGGISHLHRNSMEIEIRPVVVGNNSSQTSSEWEAKCFLVRIERVNTPKGTM